MAIWAPAGTPRDIVDLLYREPARAVGTDEMKQKMARIGFEPAAVPPEAFAARIRDNMPRWAKLIRDANIRP